MEDSAPRHRFLLGGGASPRSVGGPRRESSRTGTLSSSGPSSCPIHRSAWKGNSANFAFWGFCELRLYGVLRSSLAASNAQATPKIAHLSDAPTPIEEYAATATCVVEAQDHYMPF